MLSIQFLGEDVDLRDSLARFSSQKGYKFSQSLDKQDLLRKIPQSPPTLIIIAPSRQNSWNVFELAAEIRTLEKKIPLVLINNQSSEAQVMAALKLRVSDYFKYPVALPELVESLEGLVSTLSPRPIQAYVVSDKNAFDYGAMIGNSQLRQNIRKQLEYSAATDSTCPDHRRNRDWEGADSTSHPPRQQEASQAYCVYQLRGRSG